MRYVHCTRVCSHVISSKSQIKLSVRWIVDETSQIAKQLVSIEWSDGLNTRRRSVENVNCLLAKKEQAVHTLSDITMLVSTKIDCADKYDLFSGIRRAYCAHTTQCVFTKLAFLNLSGSFRLSPVHWTLWKLSFKVFHSCVRPSYFTFLNTNPVYLIERSAIEPNRTPIVRSRSIGCSFYLVD